VNIPEGAFTSDLSDFAVRLLGLICLKSGSEGRLQASVADMCSWTGKSSDKTVRTALKALEASGFLTRQHTRRANGYQGKDIYQVVKNYQDEEMVVKNYQDTVVKNYRTSHDKVTISTRSNTVDMSLVPNNKTYNQIKDIGNTNVSKEGPLVLVRKYEDDGDDLAGFGLVEPKVESAPKFAKNDPKTRGKRSEHEWTPMDVASEFSFLVGRKFPLLPGTVKVRDLAGALSKYRRDFHTTAVIELELMRLFMADPDNFRGVGDDGGFLYKKFLASFNRNMNKARQNLGLLAVNSKQFDETQPTSATVPTTKLIASDGTEFDRTIAGTAAFKRYENRLKEANKDG
jgi:hypothetical protein